MSCAQVMYQPYAPSPYVVQPDTPQTSTPHGTGSATTAAAPTGESRHGDGGGGGGGGGPPVLHHTQPATSALTPHTPPHAHHHHHQQQQQQQTSQSLSQPQLQRTSEAGTSNSSSQVQQQQQQAQQTSQATQQSQGQPQASSADGSGAQRSLVRPPYRVASNGSATADSDAPPPEKKFCSDSEAPPAPATPSSSSSTSSLPHGHHPHHHQGTSHHQHQHHHHHHHHHSHHHPPHTEPPGSPAEHSNQEVKYVSANCMVVTHYAGDTSAVVDEHFTRALSTPHYEKPHSPAASPMSSRNFPPSFWNSNYQSPSTSSSSSRPPSLAGHLPGTSPADLYDPYHGGLHSLQPPAPDPWAAYSLSSQAYGHRSVAHDVYQAMSSVPSSSRPYHQYSSLSFQPHLARLPGVTPVASQMPMAKPESWGARYHEAFTNPELAHGLDTNYPAAHYPNVPGLETGVPQEGAKDLYWF